MARPKKTDSKTQYTRFRVTADEKEYILKSALQAGMSEADFLRNRVFGDRKEKEKVKQAFYDEFREIKRQNYIISHLLIMVASDLNRNETYSGKPLTEKAKEKILDYLNYITEEAEKTFK